MVPAVHSGQTLAAASVPVLLGLAAEEVCGPGLNSERAHPLVAVAVSVDQPDYPAGEELNAAAPPVGYFSSEVLPAFPEEKMQAFYGLPAGYTAAGLPCHEVDNGNSRCATHAAALAGDTGLQNTVAGILAAGHESGQNHASTGSNHFAAAPSRGPSADPSGAAHSTATR